MRLWSDPNVVWAQAGAMLVKQAAAEATATYALAGQLYLSSTGFLLLSVPNAVARGAFDAMDEPGIELPPGPDGRFNAHITVMRPEEIEQLGGATRLTERGHTFHYNLGRVKTVVPAGWPEMSRCWFIEVISPELMNLRRSYGLTALPNRDGALLPFHCTIAVRRKHVLRKNEVSKVSAVLRPDYYKHENVKSAGVNEDRELNAKLDEAAADIEQNPTEAQKESGNYRKGHVRLHGLALTIENGRGHTRSGVGRDGKRWSCRMAHHYGYIKQTESEADQDHIDIFVGPNPSSELVFAVDQVDPQTGAFDEGKFLLGFTNTAEAKQGYLDCYSPGWTGLGRISAVTMPQFKEWLEHGKTGEEFRLAQAESRAKAGASRFTEPAGVSGLTTDERSLQQPEKQAISALRSQRDHSLHKLAEFFQSLLPGPGPTAEFQTLAGASQQLAELYTGELLLGDLSHAGTKQAEQPVADLSRPPTSDCRLGERAGHFQASNQPETSGRLERAKNVKHSAERLSESYSQIADVSRANTASSNVGSGAGAKLRYPENPIETWSERCAGVDNALVAEMAEHKYYEPICPHCHEEMPERHYLPDHEQPGLYRHRGECYDKGAFKIPWPRQTNADEFFTSGPLAGRTSESD